MTRGGPAALLILAGLAAAEPVSAQFTQFTQCHGAYPCNRPFGLQYNPDPLIAGPWAQGAPTAAVSAHVELKKNPEVVVDKPPALPLSADPVDASVRAFLRRYPKPAPPKEKPPAGSAAAPAPSPPKP
jgi:hypothetical protein